MQAGSDAGGEPELKHVPTFDADRAPVHPA